MRTAASSPSKVIFESVGLAMPPCGVPLRVGNEIPFSTYPAFNHCCKIRFSKGIFSNIHSCNILSKQPRISPSSIHVAEFGLERALKAAAIASAHARPSRNPYEFLSAVVSATGASVSFYNAYIALSDIVGILKGRVLFLFFFGMYILRNGCALYHHVSAG